jgi:hypothetical protein
MKMSSTNVPPRKQEKRENDLLIELDAKQLKVRISIKRLLIVSMLVSGSAALATLLSQGLP